MRDSTLHYPLSTSVCSAAELITTHAAAVVTSVSCAAVPRAQSAARLCSGWLGRAQIRSAYLVTGHQSPSSPAALAPLRQDRSTTLHDSPRLSTTLHDCSFSLDSPRRNILHLGRTSEGRRCSKRAISQRLASADRSSDVSRSQIADNLRAQSPLEFS